MEPIRVFIADDHELVRYAMRTLLESEPDMAVAGEAEDTQSAIDGCLKEDPDVVLLDIRMPGEGGVEVCRAVREACPNAQVLVLTSFDDDDEVFGVLSAGAAGYILKGTKPDRIVRAIRAVADGQSVFDSSVASRIISGRTRGTADGAMDALSERELQVLQLMAKGLSNKDIGRALWIGETTVKTHVSHILRKLRQSDRTQAVLVAVKSGIVGLKQ
jgi:two-component system, NarL family, response regulator